MFSSGTLEADFSDKTCSNDFFNSSAEFSLFESVDVGQNNAVFGVGDQGYSGTVEVRETPSATKTELRLMGWNPSEKKFVAALIVPSCSN